jgi:2-dehydropantoate 2-reductase
MKVCVFGAGAIGGHLAAKLLRAGRHEVSLIARGAQLQAIRTRGLTLRTGGEEFTVRPHAATDARRELPAQNFVIVTLKAQAQPGAAADIAALLAPGGSAVFANNGIPWWWTHRGADAPGRPLPLLDPGAQLWNHVGPERAIGCVIFSANEVVEPGVIQHTNNNNRFLLGEPDGRISERVQALAQVMTEAGIGGEPTSDIRRWVWTKLLRNAPVNPLCALTRLPVQALDADPQLLGLYYAVVDELAALAAAEGVDLGAEVPVAREVAHKGPSLDGSASRAIRPSMLQDALAGRSMEVEAILGQLQEFGREYGVATPTIDVLLPLLRGLDRSIESMRQGEVR